MWISNKIFDFLSSTREDLIKSNTERDTLRAELQKANILCDWLRLQVNTLQMERTQLIEKAFGIKVPVPVIEKASVSGEANSMEDFSFDDIGDELAKKLGLPTYN